MPFIKIKVSNEISSEKEEIMKSRLGKAIEIIPGKTEEYLLLEFEDNCHLWLKGDKDKPIAYIEAAIFGNENHIGFDLFTKELTDIISSELEIDPMNIYIKYEDIISWGVSGRFIDRRMYG